MHHLLTEFVIVTEEAAIETLPWVGRGDKIRADEAATSSMRRNLNNMEMNGVIVIGEGEIDEAPMLHIDEIVGKGIGSELDIAVDPIDGTTPIAEGRDHGITVIAAAPKGSLLHAPDMYMEKIVVGQEAVGKIDLEAPLMENLQAVAWAKNKPISELCVLVQDRPRHAKAIKEMRAHGVQVELFNDGDVLQSLLPCIDGEKFDMLYNIGGAPEGVLSAVALKCLGGEMQARLFFYHEEDYARCLEMGIVEPKAALRHDQLVASNEGVFVATAITDTVFLKGINQSKNQLTTQTLAIHSGKTHQIIKTTRIVE